MFKDDFEGLIKKTCDQFRFPELQISFEDKVVDLLTKTDRGRSRYFAEYSLVVTGNPYFLGLSPYTSGYRPVDLLVEVAENVLSFMVDTASYQEELSADSTEKVKREFMRIKQFITETEEHLNRTIEFYNDELEKIVVKQLANKLRRALRCEQIRQALNF